MPAIISNSNNLIYIPLFQRGHRRVGIKGKADVLVLQLSKVCRDHIDRLILLR